MFISNVSCFSLVRLVLGKRSEMERPVEKIYGGILHICQWDVPRQKWGEKTDLLNCGSEQLNNETVTTDWKFNPLEVG